MSATKISKIKRPLELRVMHHINLVRHGTTKDIEKRLMQGSSDSPLSVRGRQDEQQTAEANIPTRSDAL